MTQKHKKGKYIPTSPAYKPLSNHFLLLNTNQVKLPINLLVLLRTSVSSSECSEVEPDQDEVPAATGVVDTSSVCHGSPVTNDFGPVGVRFKEKVDSCFLAKQYIDSGTVKDKLRAVTSLKV